MHDLHHHLLGFHGSKDISANGLLLHIVAEFLSNFVTNIRIQKRPANFLQGLSYIYLTYLTFALQNLEGPF